MNSVFEPPQSGGEHTAEVTVTSWHPSARGGGVMIGRDGFGQPRRVIISDGVAARSPEEGETWRVSGASRHHPDYGWQLYATVALPLQPSGRGIVRYLATSQRFPGVGWKTADRLWTSFGEGLYDLLRTGDATAIARVIGPERAVGIVAGFGLLAGEVEVFHWLDRYGVQPRTAAAAAGLWGLGAIERIATDPYALVLLEPWSTVDARALRLGIQPGDTRRTRAAVEEALARIWRLGRTAALEADVLSHYHSLMGGDAEVSASVAVADALSVGRAVRRGDGLLQSRAALFMECEVTRMLGARLASRTEALPDATLESIVTVFPQSSGFELTGRQKEAVRIAAGARLAVIAGGAGTGKTSVVRAVLSAYDAKARSMAAEPCSGFAVRQVAVAGRAAKRIAEATGRPASTVARLLRRLEAGRDSIRSGVLVLDEASMLDLPTLYRLLVALPTEVSLLLVGDPGQLPPIGPGAPFQDLASDDATPKATLTVVHRQSDTTGIPAIAAAIRRGKLPDLRRFNPTSPLQHGVYFVPARGAATASATLAVFRAMAGSPPARGKVDDLHNLDIQVISPLLNGISGVKALNAAIEHEWMAQQDPIGGWGLAIGSKVLWLKNDYDKAPIIVHGEPVVDATTGKPVCAGFINGAIGIVRRQVSNGAWVEFDDGAADVVAQSDLERLTRGWAISVHKAQGSAFRRVIVPIGRSRLLDRALIYTAITRATETVVIVGDPDLLREAVESPPRASSRPRTLMLRAA